MQKSESQAIEQQQKQQSESKKRPRQEFLDGLQDPSSQQQQELAG